MKRTDFHNLTLVAEDDLRNSEDYRVQALKERMYSASVACDSSGANPVSYFGVVKEPADLRFVGTENSSIADTQFTIGNGVSYTRFDPTSISNPQYIGFERVGLANSLAVTIKSMTPSIKYYTFLVYVELQKNKKFDEGGSNAYFVDREDAFLVVQMTSAEALSLGSFISTPNASVVISTIAAPHLDTLFSPFTNDEKTATFGSWTNPLGIFTVGSFTVTHYNSVFLGEIEVIDAAHYKFYHTLPGADPLSGTMFRSGFSIADQFHRTEIGRGTSSSTNPHGMILQDLGNLDDVRELTSSGIVPKFTTSLECVINDSAGRIDVTSIAANEYLFMNGKRVKSLTNSSIPYGSLTAGINYIYVMIDPTPSIGGPFTQNTAPWNYYIGTLATLTSIPGSNAFVLCSVWWDGATHAYAYNGDPRFVIGGTLNPVTDLRVFGTDGYDYIHNTVFESSGKENLVPNGSMQIAENGKIKGWTTGTQAVLTSSKNTPSAGSTALEIADGFTDASLLFPFDSTSNYSFRARLHTQGSAPAYTAVLAFYRGKDRVLDRVGTFTLNSGSPTYSVWTLIESEFLGNSTITYSGGFPSADRANIGWASIEIATAGAKLYVDDVVLRPKIRTIDILDQNVTTVKIADNNVTTVKIADNNVTGAKIPKAVHSIVKGHLDATSDATTIEALVDGGNADTLHSHAVGSANILTASAATNTVNLALTDGTWFVQAWGAWWHVIDIPAALVIDGVTVQAWGISGDSDGVDYGPLFGARSGVTAPGGRTITVSFNPSGIENHITVVATRTS